jgi:hypothetical protein
MEAFTVILAVPPQIRVLTPVADQAARPFAAMTPAAAGTAQPEAS